MSSLTPHAVPGPAPSPGSSTPWTPSRRLKKDGRSPIIIGGLSPAFHLLAVLRAQKQAHGRISEKCQCLKRRGEQFQHIVMGMYIEAKI